MLTLNVKLHYIAFLLGQYHLFLHVQSKRNSFLSVICQHNNTQLNIYVRNYKIARRLYMTEYLEKFIPVNVGHLADKRLKINIILHIP